MDPNSRSAKFETMQPRLGGTGGLRLHIAYLVKCARPPAASQEIPRPQTLLADYLGPCQQYLGQRSILVDWKHEK